MVSARSKRVRKARRGKAATPQELTPKLAAGPKTRHLWIKHVSKVDWPTVGWRRPGACRTDAPSRGWTLHEQEFGPTRMTSRRSFLSFTLLLTGGLPLIAACTPPPPPSP